MSIVVFIIIIGILLIIAELLALGLRMTGLDREKARFQVVSIITGTGFTTNESELITQHPVRRKIAELLMLISYVVQAFIIGTIFTIAAEVANGKNVMVGLFFLLVTVIMLVGVTKNAWVVQKIEKMIEKRFIIKSKVNKTKTVEQVLKLNEDYGVVEFLIESEHPLIGKTLVESNLKKIQIQVLNIERGSYIEQFPKKDSYFKEGDRVVVYGKLENIKKVVMPKFTDT
ncbi:MAG: TrkA C-terminal domain-containing protein [Clostridia bacterium]|nr:TrkA C-terminal domain-containing protein [Clostridia bacterium]